MKVKVHPTDLFFDCLAAIEAPSVSPSLEGKGAFLVRGIYLPANHNGLSIAISKKRDSTRVFIDIVSGHIDWVMGAFTAAKSRALGPRFPKADIHLESFRCDVESAAFGHFYAKLVQISPWDLPGEPWRGGGRNWMNLRGDFLDSERRYHTFAALTPLPDDIPQLNSYFRFLCDFVLGEAISSKAKTHVENVVEYLSR